MNQLATQTSPYLRQHAENPVDWLPWGEEAFLLAAERDRPILLSVGYSACHWCHVMAHESFEDADVAAVMNEHFVNVKVDREERPDVDAIYMQAVQALTGRGGWPMTVFLDPEGRPFYGGTYYPKEPRQGMPGFVQLLEAVSDAWKHRRVELLDQAAKLHDAIRRSSSLEGLALAPEADMPEGHAVLDGAYQGIRDQFDATHGGFGRAPKFPQAMTLDFLLGVWLRDRSDETLHMVTHSLDRMAAGGLYDQIGGGFHRYSVDAYWLVPHFEKMLYDQALLVRTSLHAYLATGEPRYRRIVEDTIGYVLRDLRHPAGGFSSAEDADSEGVEGKFYVWSRDELREVCGADADEVERYFGVTEGGNFEGANILHVVDPSEDRPDAVRRAVPKLFEARARRVRPALDDKVLTAWNALFLRGLAEAGAALGRDDWIDAARDAARFLLTELRRSDGRVLRSWQDGRAHLLGYAEDYAALTEALVTLAEVDDVRWLDDARTVADGLIELFEDAEHGGFFTTGRDADALIVRPKDIEDNAVPSENSLAANGLLRLGALTGERRYPDLAHRWLERISPILARYPTGFAYTLGALERSVTPPLEVAIIGDDDSTAPLRAEVFGRLLPCSVAVAAAPGVGGELTPLLADRTTSNGRATAFVCEDYVCEQPVTNASSLRAQLDTALERRRG